MKQLRKIRNYFKSVKGKEVGSGYFKHEVTDCRDSDLTIDIVDWLDCISDYEVDDEINICENLDDEERIIMDLGDYIEENCKEINIHNTYNWCSPISNDVNFNIYEHVDYGYMYVILRVHISGDVRYNYTENIYLRFDDISDLYDSFSEADKWKVIEIDYEKYTIETRFWQEGNSVYSERSGDLEYTKSQEIINKAIELKLIK